MNPARACDKCWRRIEIFSILEAYTKYNGSKKKTYCYDHATQVFIVVGYSRIPLIYRIPTHINTHNNNLCNAKPYIFDQTSRDP